MITATTGRFAPLLREMRESEEMNMSHDLLQDILSAILLFLICILAKRIDTAHERIDKWQNRQ